MSATTIVGVIAGPLCGSILKYMNGVNGWAGWQWLFLIQGLPAAVLGVLIYFLLQDKPADADWLTSTEKNVVRYNLETDVKDIESESEGTRWDMFCDPKVCLLSLVYLVLLGATYTMVFWLPTLIQSWGVKDLFLIGIYSDYSERSGGHWHDPDWARLRQMARAALAFRCLCRHRCARPRHHDAVGGALVASITALSFAVIGIAAATPLFFTLVTEYLSAAAAAAGIALISSLGNLGPVVAPSINGWIVQHTGSTTYALYLVMVLYVLSGLLVLVTVHAARAQAADRELPSSQSASA
jgi:nitrate/nitrite transporter NarK